MQQQDVLNLVLEQDDISWKTILYDLVKSEQMNPWDIDISVLTKRYIETIKKMQVLDFRLSGKVLLAATILLKMKSTHLLQHGVDELDRLLARSEEVDINNEFFSEFSDELFQVADKIDEDEPRLIPRTPQPRQRKITIHDLAEALQKAMEVKKRKLARRYPDIKIEIPKKKFDISEVIREVYGKIKAFLFRNQNKKLTFSKLLPEACTKEEKIFTFIPLLHLDHQRKIDIWQQVHFGDIEITLLKVRQQADKELGLDKTAA